MTKKRTKLCLLSTCLRRRDESRQRIKWSQLSRYARHSLHRISQFPISVGIEPTETTPDKILGRGVQYAEIGLSGQPLPLIMTTLGEYMKLTQLRIRNFQCFGEEATVISLEPMTFLLGPNGAGKTAVLQALTRLFGFERSMRDIKRTDFHTSSTVLDTEEIETQTLWIEAEFEFRELKKSNGKYATVPSYFAHMQLASAESLPRTPACAGRSRFPAARDTR
jgi:hypothetical protein